MTLFLRPGPHTNNVDLVFVRENGYFLASAFGQNLLRNALHIAKQPRHPTGVVVDLQNGPFGSP